MESQYLRIHIIHKPFMNLSYGTANQSTTYKLLSTDNKRLERLPLYFHVRGEVLAQWLFPGFSIHLHIGVFPLSTSDFQSNSWCLKDINRNQWGWSLRKTNFHNANYGNIKKQGGPRPFTFREMGYDQICQHIPYKRKENEPSTLAGKKKVFTSNWKWTQYEV